MAIFGSIAYINSKASTIVFVAVLVFLLLFEGVLHVFEAKCKEYGFKALAEKIYREFMIMGLISFGTYITSEIYSFQVNKWFFAFDFTHIIVLFIALTFVVQATLLVMMITSRRRTLIRFGLVSSAELLVQYDKILSAATSNSLKDRIRHFLFFKGPSFWRYPKFRENIELKIIQGFFIRSYNLPPEFNFATFYMDSLRNYIMSLLDVRPFQWLLLASLVVLNYIRIITIDRYFEKKVCGYHDRNPHHTIAENVTSHDLIPSFSSRRLSSGGSYSPEAYASPYACELYTLRYASVCILLLMVFVAILVFFSELYMQRLLDRVLDQEDGVKQESNKEEARVRSNSVHSLHSLASPNSFRLPKSPRIQEPQDIEEGKEVIVVKSPRDSVNLKDIDVAKIMSQKEDSKSQVKNDTTNAEEDKNSEGSLAVNEYDSVDEDNPEESGKSRLRSNSMNSISSFDLNKRIRVEDEVEIPPINEYESVLKRHDNNNGDAEAVDPISTTPPNETKNEESDNVITVSYGKQGKKSNKSFFGRLSFTVDQFNANRRLTSAALEPYREDYNRKQKEKEKEAAENPPIKNSATFAIDIVDDDMAVEESGERRMPSSHHNKRGSAASSHRGSAVSISGIAELIENIISRQAALFGNEENPVASTKKSFCSSILSVFSFFSLNRRRHLYVHCLRRIWHEELLRKNTQATRASILSRGGDALDDSSTSALTGMHAMTTLLNKGLSSRGGMAKMRTSEAMESLLTSVAADYKDLVRKRSKSRISVKNSPSSLPTPKPSGSKSYSTYYFEVEDSRSRKGSVFSIGSHSQQDEVTGCLNHCQRKSKSVFNSIKEYGNWLYDILMGYNIRPSADYPRRKRLQIQAMKAQQGAQDAGRRLSVGSVTEAHYRDIMNNEDDNGLQAERDISSIFVNSSPDLYYHAIEFATLLQSLYLALWATNFVTMSFASTTPLQWILAMTVPIIINFYMLKEVILVASTLKCISEPSMKLVDIVCENAVDEMNVSLRLRKLLRQALSTSVTDKSLRRPLLQNMFESYCERSMTEGLSLDRFSALLHALQVRLTRKSLTRIFTVLDTDKDGLLTWLDLSTIVFPEHVNARSKHRYQKRSPRKSKTNADGNNDDDDNNDDDNDSSAQSDETEASHDQPEHENSHRKSLFPAFFNPFKSKSSKENLDDPSWYSEESPATLSLKLPGESQRYQHLHHTQGHAHDDSDIGLHEMNHSENAHEVDPSITFQRRNSHFLDV